MTGDQSTTSPAGGGEVEAISTTIIHPGSSSSTNRKYCSLCSGTFANNYTLRRHIQRYHKDTDTASTSAPTVSILPPITSTRVEEAEEGEVLMEGEAPKEGEGDEEEEEEEDHLPAGDAQESGRTEIPSTSAALMDYTEAVSTDVTDLDSFFELKRLSVKRNERFRTSTIEYAVTFRPLAPVMNRLEAVFDRIIEKVIADASEPSANPRITERVRFVLHAPGLDYVISVPFAPVNEMTGAAVLNKIQHVLNSNQSFEIGDGIRINFTAITLPAMGSPSKPGGIKKRKMPSLSDWRKSKRSLIPISVEGNDCLLAAIAMGRSRLQGRKTQVRCQKKLMAELKNELTQSGIFLPSRPHIEPRPSPGEQNRLVVEDLDSIGKYLKDYCIALYDATFCAEVIHVTNPRVKANFIDLLYDGTNNHVDVITSMKALLETSTYCHDCHQGQSTAAHLCPSSSCVLCRTPGCKNLLLFTDEKPTSCSGCGWVLRTKDCYNHHEEESLCRNFYQCCDCGETMRKTYRYRHKCGYIRCRTCGVHYRKGETATLSTRTSLTSSGTLAMAMGLQKSTGKSSSEPNHQCFIQKIKDNQQAEIAFDFTDWQQGRIDTTTNTTTTTRKRSLNESTSAVDHTLLPAEMTPTPATHGAGGQLRKQQTVPDSQMFAFDIETDQSGETHKAVMLIMGSLDSNSRARDFKVFKGYDCIDSFCKHIFLDPENKSVPQWFFAHFGSGFDFLPILQWLHAYGKMLPQIVVRGNRIITMKVANKRFIDSFLFVPIPLAKFPKTFGFPEAKKGFFPHLMTSPDNLDFEGERCYFPEKHYFGPSQMSTSKLAEFEVWHADQTRLYREEEHIYSFCESKWRSIVQTMLCC